MSASDKTPKSYVGFERRSEPYSRKPDEGAPKLMQMAQRELSDIAVRRQVLGVNLPGEAAWDMLLMLYVSRYKRDILQSTSLGYLLEIPTSTLLRYLRILEDFNFVERYATEDSRVRAVKLTDFGYERMSEYFVRKVLANT